MVSGKLDGSESTVTVESAYRRLWPIVRGKCARMMVDESEAEDVAQQTFERLWLAGIANEEPKAVTAWIYKTSTRLVLDRLRRRKVRDAYRPDVLETPGPHGRAAARQTLIRLASSVPKVEFEAVILSRVDGLTQAEVAEVLSVSERTVRRYLTRFDKRGINL